MPGAGKPAGWFQGALQSDLQEADSDEYLEFLKARGEEGGERGGWVGIAGISDSRTES